MKTITIYKTLDYGWLITFEPNNPWAMPVGPIPLPFTYAAERSMVAEDVASRFDGAEVI